MIQVVSVVLVLAGLYLILLGTGRGRNFKPVRLRGNPETAVVGRVILLFGVLLLPTLLGFTLADVEGWLEDIWTSGGGVGTG
jgi:hypothetical protein